MNIILIIIALLVVLILYAKFSHAKTQWFYKGFGVVVVLFLVSVLYVWLKSGVNLSSYEGFLSLGKTYFNWLGSIAGNFGSITGNVVKHDWGLNSSVGSTINSNVNSVVNSTFIPAP